jgi:hypothetical protein
MGTAVYNDYNILKSDKNILAPFKETIKVQLPSLKSHALIIYSIARSHSSLTQIV